METMTLVELLLNKDTRVLCFLEFVLILSVITSLLGFLFVYYKYFYNSITIHKAITLKEIILFDLILIVMLIAINVLIFSLSIYAI